MAHGHATTEVRGAQKRALWLALWANLGLVVAEFIGGLAFHSLALLADAAHAFSDVVALAIAIGAHHLIERPVSDRHTYGLQRAEVLGALANGLILIGLTAWVFIEAFQRLDRPEDVAAGGLIVIASIGLAVNLGSAWLLAKNRGNSLNMRGALIHMLADAAGSFGVLVAGVAILLWDAPKVDPVISMVIGALILWSTWGLLRDAVQVLLEGTPRGMDPASVERALAEDTGVESVHHLHLWNLASDTPALSAHVVLVGEVSLHEAQERGEGLKVMLEERFGIGHATLELECHDCDPPGLTGGLDPAD